MGTQIDKMELTTGQRGVVREQEEHNQSVIDEINEFHKENAKQSALRSIKLDGEKGIERVMYAYCDNYENYTEFEKAMKRVAHKAYAQWLEDTQGASEESEVGQGYPYSEHPDYPKC